MSPGRSVRWWVAVVAVLALVVTAVGLVVLATSSLDLPRKGVAPERNEAARVAPEARLQEFYDQELDWEDCGSGARCAEMEVPLDYADPSGERILVAVLKRPADQPGDRVGSLVVNPGGPGAPGTAYAENGAAVFRPALTDRFDLVGFDPRGVGRSSAVDCVSDEDLDEFVASDPDPDSRAEEAEAVELMKSFGAGCRERSGDLAAHVSTVEAARDLDVLRALVEEDRLTYFGASYGTKLGATYADLFPDRAGRLVLDGAVDVSLSVHDLALQQAIGFDTALAAYIRNCLSVTDSCFLGDSVEEGRARILELLSQVDAAPLPAGERELDSGNAFYGIAVPLYDRDYWFYLSAALRDAFDGDGTALLQLSDAYASRRPDGSYQDNSMEAIYVINCLDDPAYATPDRIREQESAFEEAAPVFGRAQAWSQLDCIGLQEGSAEEDRTIRGAGAPPIVVIGTTRDPATPYAWAESLADQLESGVLVSRDGDGHTGYNAGNECVDRAVEDYLLDGVVPQDGLDC